MIVLTYCDQKYEEQRKLIDKVCSKFNIRHIRKTRDDLVSTEFYKSHKSILDQPVGAGYWLWKPFFILNEVEKLPQGEILFYLDSGDIFDPELIPMVESSMKNKDYLFMLGSTLFEHRNSSYTKRDTFIEMNCDEQKYWDSPQIEAGVSFWKNSEASIQLLNKWLACCTEWNSISNEPSQLGSDFPNFIAHRNDQSILTNLAVTYGLTHEPLLRQYVECNLQYYNPHMSRPIDKFIDKLHAI